jgi:hypothetical protein
VEKQWRKKGVTYYFVLLSVDFRPMVERSCFAVVEKVIERRYFAVVEEVIDRPCFAVVEVAAWGA